MEGGGTGSDGLIIELPGENRVRGNPPLQLCLVAELLTIMAQTINRG